MTKPVEITLASRTFTCDKNSKASVIFTISNIIDKDIDLAASIFIDEENESVAKEEWFDIKIEPNWVLGSKTTEEIKVEVTIPEAQELGDYKFKLTVYSKENPGDDFTSSEMVLVKKEEIIIADDEPKKSFPWWIVALVIALIVIAIIGWKVFSEDDKPLPPPVTEMTLPNVLKLKLSYAMDKINRAGFEVDTAKIERQYQKNMNEEIVIKQTPKAGTVKKGTKVKLVVSTKTHMIIGKPVYILPAQLMKYEAIQSRNLEKIE